MEKYGTLRQICHRDMEKYGTLRQIRHRDMEKYGTLRQIRHRDMEDLTIHFLLSSSHHCILKSPPKLFRDGITYIISGEHILL